MNRRDIIFLGILFLAIIIIGMLYVSYFKNIVEGFDRDLIVDIQTNIFDGSSGNLVTDIKNMHVDSSLNIEISNYIKPIATDLSSILHGGFCNKNDCSGVPQPILTDLYSNYTGLSTYLKYTAPFNASNTIPIYFNNINNDISNISMKCVKGVCH